MKAYAITEAGGAPALIEIPIPEPDEGEVRVRVSAASVNGFDLAVAAGFMGPLHREYSLDEVAEPAGAWGHHTVGRLIVATED